MAFPIALATARVSHCPAPGLGLTLGLTLPPALGPGWAWHCHCHAVGEWQWHRNLEQNVGPTTGYHLPCFQYHILKYVYKCHLYQTSDLLNYSISFRSVGRITSNSQVKICVWACFKTWRAALRSFTTPLFSFTTSTPNGGCVGVEILLGENVASFGRCPQRAPSFSKYRLHRRSVIFYRFVNCTYLTGHGRILLVSPAVSESCVSDNRSHCRLILIFHCVYPLYHNSARS